MKRLCHLSLFLLSSLSFAQMPMQMNEQDMQQMMAAMQEIQACFAQIDRREVDALQQRSLKFSSELQSLCNAGKRAEAEKQALAFYDKMMADKTVKQVKVCGEKVPASLKAMAQMPLDYSQYQKQQDQHVCDHIGMLGQFK